MRLGRKITPFCIVALQSILGSDPGRESLNLMRLLQIERHGADRFSAARWNLMFERKLKA